MGRAKLPMKRISLDKNRNITYKKRSNGLKKKVSEFGTLCDVKVCLICMGPPQEPHLEAVTWPEDRRAVEAIVEAYLDRSPEELNKRTSGISTYLTEQTKKLAQELEKCKRENRELVYPSWDHRLDEWSVDNLRDLASDLDVKIEMVNKKIESMKGKQIIDLGMLKNPKIDLPIVPFSCAKPATNLCTPLILDPMMNNEGNTVLHDEYYSSNSFNNFSLCGAPSVETYGNVFTGTAMNYNVKYQNYNQAVCGQASSSSSLGFLPQPLATFPAPSSFTQLPAANQLGDGFCCTFQSAHKY